MIGVLKSLIVVIYLSEFTASDNNVCDAGALVCKPTLVTKNIGKLIRRWLAKLRKNPSCFTGVDSELTPGDNDTMELVSRRNGRKHGLGLRYLDDGQQYLSGVSMYRDGENVGPEWDLTLGRGHNSSYFFKSLSDTYQSQDDPESPLNMFGGGALYNRRVWLHPDLETVMVGQWSRDGIMEQGEEGSILGVQCNNGIMELSVKTVKGGKLFKYDSATADKISSYPTNSDKYESLNVKLKPSKITGGGEGLFSKRKLLKGQLVSYFNGFKVPVEYVESSWIEKMNGAENFENLSENDPLFDEYLERKSYVIGLDMDHDLDLPPEIANNTERYCATLGHKVNHAVRPNCYFGWAFHPLYGR